MKVNGTLIVEHDFGSLKGEEYKLLSVVYTPAASGMHSLLIENSANSNPIYDLHNYIDNISFLPQVVTLNVEDINIPCQTGGTANFEIRGSLANGKKDYWLLMSASGNYPGVNSGGVNIPLNWGPLFSLSLSHPYFPGTTGFFGKLDMFGMANPTLALPPDPQQQFLNIPVYFSFIILSPGPKLPITHVSSPVHIKYTP